MVCSVSFGNSSPAALLRPVWPCRNLKSREDGNMSAEGLILNCENVVVDYDGFKALNNCNFSVHYNELRVVIGPNGAGKTTLLDCICGKTKPSSGKIAFGNNIELVGKNAEDITKLGVGRKFQA